MPGLTGPRTGRLFGLMACLLLLAACYRYPPPVAVSFPDDPRVLHGEWAMDLRLRQPGFDSYLHLPNRAMLITWNQRSARVFLQDASGEGHEQPDASTFDGLSPATFDDSLNAFMRLNVGAESATVQTVPVGGEPAPTPVQFNLPAELQVSSRHIGTGRVYLIGRTGAGMEVHWWNSQTGEHEGQHTVNAPHGVQTSSNGRIISFWNVDGGRVQVLDTANPAELKTVRLGICRSNGTAEASGDGRWFVISDCRARFELIDLQAAEPRRMGTGFGRAGPARFADDSNEFIWLDSAGVISSFDPLSRERQVLFTIPDMESYFHGRISLNRSAGLLSVLDPDGRILLVDVASGAIESELPEPVTATIRLDLVADNIDNTYPRHSSYEVTGSAEPPASLNLPASLEVAGTIYSSGLHEYTPASLRGQSLPPPSVHGHLSLFEPGDSEAPLMNFDFWETDARATSFEGILGDEVGVREFEGLLRRREAEQ